MRYHAQKDENEKVEENENESALGLMKPKFTDAHLCKSCGFIKGPISMPGRNKASRRLEDDGGGCVNQRTFFIGGFSISEAWRQEQRTDVQRDLDEGHRLGDEDLLQRKPSRIEPWRLMVVL
jgi:hypothetical protein